MSGGRQTFLDENRSPRGELCVRGRRCGVNDFTSAGRRLFHLRSTIWVPTDPPRLHLATRVLFRHISTGQRSPNPTNVSNPHFTSSRIIVNYPNAFLLNSDLAT